jgi:hypothetical protein
VELAKSWFLCICLLTKTGWKVIPDISSFCFCFLA